MKQKCYHSACKIVFLAWSGPFEQVAMIWMDHAQPALLYLVPACVGVPSLLALVRGDKELFTYDEEALAEAEEAAKSTEEKKAD